MVITKGIIRSQGGSKKVSTSTKLEIGRALELFGSFSENLQEIKCYLFSRYLLSYNFEAVHGFTFGIDAIKSLLLMTAIADKKINVEEAVKLSRLEVDYQVNIITITIVLGLKRLNRIFSVICS